MLETAVELARRRARVDWSLAVPQVFQGKVQYADSYFINATSQEAPGIVDRKRVKITDPLAIYSGCYIRAAVNFYPFNANGNRGIACGLQNIQFWEDGEPLNGRVRAENEFDSLDDEDDEDFLD